MNFTNWYTDLMDIKRVVDTTSDGLTSSTRKTVYTGVPCRVYQDAGGAPSYKRQAADISQSIKLACKNDVDIQAGDELIITRGGGLGHKKELNRGFAGEPHHYYEPFGAVAPQLEHQEVVINQLERI